MFRFKSILFILFVIEWPTFIFPIHFLWPCKKYNFSFQGGVIPSENRPVEGFSLTLEQVDRHQAGIYQCSANNGVGPPASFDITLNVLCEYKKHLLFSISIS
jgi:hypothetical protein